MCSRNNPTLWFVRVGDGKNFRNSKYPSWGLKRGRHGCIKTIVDKIKPGDILCFITSKLYGGKVIGISEYTGYHDRHNEPLITINTYSNREQHWKGEDDWSIQIHYKDLYITEKQNIKAIIQCSAIILEYETFKDRGLPDLYNHYNNFKYYGEPKKF